MCALTFCRDEPLADATRIGHSVWVVRRKRTPQEKKRLSLERDTADAGFKGQRSSRRGWAKKKARLERAYRKAWKRSLQAAAGSDDEDSISVRREPHRKSALPRLREKIQNRQWRRARLQAEPRKLEEARARRRRRRGTAE
jgi:hypothetical protein